MPPAPSEAVATPTPARAALRIPDPPSDAGSADYRLSPLDTLDISVFQVPDLTRTVEINASGLITLPLIGSVQAGGKTTRELEAQLAAKLGAKYLQNPQVSVSVKDSVSQRITVDGAVHKPGVYPMRGETTLLQALATAGGLDDTADDQGVLILRGSKEQRLAAKFDVTAIRKGQQSDPPVQAGDLVMVDQSGAKSVWRGVRETLPAVALFAPLI